ncbi:MAG: alpha/beta fold hydrolase [Planctomycetes bacterium]|nr:alpha/beta fold hydrolase [Planctomycetota bacterium]
MTALLAILALLFGPPILLAAVYLGWVIASHAVFARHAEHYVPPPHAYGFLRSFPFYVTEAAAMCLARIHAIRYRGRDRLDGPPSPTGRPVLLVHGFFQNASGFRRMRVYLHAHGRETYVVNLGRSFRSIETYVDVLVQRMRELREELGERELDVIAHSMGGLVVRGALAAAPELRESVATVVTLASPHGGTEGALGLGCFPDVRQMQPGSGFLEGLPGLEELVPKARRFTVSVERDYIVYPRATCHLPGCEARHVPKLGHVGLMVYHRGYSILAELLELAQASRVQRCRNPAGHTPW